MRIQKTPVDKPVYCKVSYKNKEAWAHVVNSCVFIEWQEKSHTFSVVYELSQNLMAINKLLKKLLY